MAYTRKILTASAFTALLISTQANALVCVNCATITQMATNNINQAQSYAEVVQQTLNQVKSLQNQVQSINYQIQNLKNIDVHNWGDAKAQIDRLGRVAQTGKAMAFSLVDLNEQWNDQFRGYEQWETEVQTNDMVTQQYREWGEMMQDTSMSALSLANEMSTVQAEDESTITALQNNSSSADGAMQVAQAGNEIAAQTTRQLQKMQTLLQADIQMTATSTALAEEKLAQQRAADNSTIADPEINIHDGQDWTDLWD
ncbi:P-type conjugative transfer protein TrbJ [Vibrio parahaemolyticus]|uniref:P-type conjugative transfer protein TrbJ n=1 Tax=Vibrio parahaemolyticus TaxID=670 RepID=UPI001781A8DB|nr:P-type conjugative transfer protein TrbJ [Vibrio parahaemolyticus]MBD6944392.1 P-type conjugative transfer protein TrbJ [Vibrio parahaemolyticus]MBD6978927.1 P-type conjugative transfer protein TrbJ [Vibrio parahaemolyticus]MBD6990990.1 P-type conjugative transfer protein TrbJ [Vibrio parahaemolyticus]WOZ62893.1 P-type conjugative transfer protein TrbJ [Vibrio parahaemolyticus]WOZ62919.1 P-type conjugative transfer protein TrbJ [Vibrio parahaemolyticus]